MKLNVKAVVEAAHWDETVFFEVGFGDNKTTIQNKARNIFKEEIGRKPKIAEIYYEFSLPDDSSEIYWDGEEERTWCGVEMLVAAHITEKEFIDSVTKAGWWENGNCESGVINVPIG